MVSSLPRSNQAQEDGLGEVRRQLYLDRTSLRNAGLWQIKVQLRDLVELSAVACQQLVPGFGHPQPVIVS